MTLKSEICDVINKIKPKLCKKKKKNNIKNDDAILLSKYDSAVKRY